MRLLEAENLCKSYGVPRPGAWFGAASLRAVDDVSLSLDSGRTLGIVGESGSGKSTLGRLIMALEEPDAGSVRFEGEDLFKLTARELRRRRRHFQVIFQDPAASLDPRQRAWEAVAEPLIVHEELRQPEARRRAGALLEQVGLETVMLDRYPHEFSGGQRQRLMIARAVSTRPKLLVADEPLSSLDITIQAQILELLEALKQDLGMAMIFISHDLRVVERLSDEVAVMRAGAVVESGPARQVYSSPRHPYTRELLAAANPLPQAVLAAMRRGRG